ncbi:DNA mismatch repair protein MutS [Tenacibaculum finnmarkense genomovar finnmarkense]|uniref:MutS-related protein n=1 Tax=Tenacibaculum finnmarkense TaxID=2781243 RepID=UPI001E2D19FF|nr:DNA mismatch repair protein MutS [Tenacibaculum finnmarkense]MCD8416652.1 DNA mismatch repair protein MutS [Tenacibaculum finnmarkense genomovar finnmarkense]MCG8184634.1 DNA mismatch repair protein MutS [Tenacibaculum finnmarkense genomovar finnmarkense]MCG8201750.1 DNA mismatch repair protein MutS [Tenacibaculum finnmarkense genomovar finnmarkense]MCG8208660.1 DNA mismatch repair protein MutS [Tenacibaculum finnmarkense genomovar finnmarkense]MCG8211391.1 DNA mismatch repair protein MutS 
MQEPIQFYKEEINSLNTTLIKLKKRLRTTSILRLLAFLTIALSAYMGFTKDNLFFILTALGVITFGILITKHLQLKQKKNLADAKLKINKTEIEVLKGNYSNLDSGEEFTNPEHYFSNDIDLFGNGSFFQYINRTATSEGKKLLANILSNNNITNIENKQKVAQELALKINWRQHFTAVASLINTKTAITTIVNWVHSYQQKLPTFLMVFSYAFSGVSLVLIGLLSFSIIPFSIVLIWFLIGLSITAFYIKNIQELASETDKAKETFNQYHQLLAQIENETFTNSILKDKQQKIQQENKKASDIFKEFSKKLDAFDQRSNFMIALAGNGLFLMDIRNTIKIEKWITTYKNTIEEWFNVVSFFDAQNSLANFVFNKPEYVFPNISKEKAVLNAVNLGHPLLNPSKRIDNDFVIDNENFFIVTGANMAGKSTFLRSISLAIVMSNTGLPICAEKVSYNPIKLITSMRTSDSLSEDESYFYAELKRLKFIVNEIKTDNYFIILDEILKGTNSQDKAIGSKKFVEKLNNSKSTGIIATHDVSLCELSNEYSSVKNYYFDAEIINDELDFDYKMKNGVCQNMNASFLLKKMEIV